MPPISMLAYCLVEESTMVAAFYKFQHGHFHSGWNASLTFPSPFPKAPQAGSDD